MVIDIIKETLLTSANTVLYLTMILVPIMIVIEYASHYKLLEKVSRFFGWLPRSLSLEPEAAFPLIVGLVFGVFYGAAVIIDYSTKGVLSKRDMMLCGIFLAVNHSIIEDNLLLGSLGANLFVLFPVRFVMAFLVVRAGAIYVDRKQNANLPAD